MYRNVVLNILFLLELYMSCSLTHDGSKTSPLQGKLQSGKENKCMKSQQHI